MVAWRIACLALSAAIYTLVTILVRDHGFNVVIAALIDTVVMFRVTLPALRPAPTEGTPR